MSQPLRIAGVQTDVHFNDIHANVATLKSFAARLAEQDIFLIAFPECFLQGYCFESLDEARDAAIRRDDLVIEEIIDFAQSIDTHIVFGFLEQVGDAVFNSCAMATRSGLLHIYHKVHLPRLGVDRFTTPGDSFQAFTVDDVTIGLNICYDCSFPEPARLLALQDVDLIVLPTNWPPGALTTAECIPNARALENNIYYMAINRIGTELGFSFIGKSKICHPNGHDLVYADHDRTAYLVSDFAPHVAREKHLVRVPDKHEIHRFADRRPEIYQPISANIKTER